ncbi:MAG TPA: hypothetical protein VGR87_14245 [Candidatus Limnocylindria bacterium]|jgi:hypothetical protein|nr:hypothetical protein [Candidatus Limnocylindria bacterium]
MRKLTGLLALVAAMALLLLSATPAYADPPGNNGTVKIHEGAGEDQPETANDPHVCTFHIHGFNFDGGSSGTWHIESWSPTNNGVTRDGTWGPASTSGEWREPKAGAMSLPDGHYKLFVKQTVPATPGGEKHKVFWVGCARQSGAEQARENLTATIGTARTVNAQLLATIHVAQQLSAAQQAAMMTVLSAAIAAQANLAAALAAAENALAQLNAAISSANAAQIAAAVAAAEEATANLNARIAAAGQASVALGAAISAAGPTTGAGSTQGTTAGGSATTSGTSAGTATTGAATSAATAVAGLQSAPQNVAAIQNLPSTSSSPEPTPFALLGVALIAVGGAVLRRLQKSPAP